MMTPSEPKAGEASIFGISRWRNASNWRMRSLSGLQFASPSSQPFGRTRLKFGTSPAARVFVEDVHRPVALVARIDVVVEALLRLRRLRPDTADTLDVVVVDRRVPGGVEAGQRAGPLRRTASARARIAPRRATLEPRLPREIPDVELVVEVVHVLMARGAIILLLAAVEL